MRADLHCHTMWSGDSTSTPDELRAAVAETALDVLCITDHNSIEGAQRLVDQLPCRVVVGEEVRTGQGEIIGLFLVERIPGGLGAAEVARRIRDQGGVVYVPHPFDPRRARLAEPVLRELVADGLVDVLEVRNAKTAREELNERSAAFAAENGLRAGAGSDAHVPEALGAAYTQLPAFGDAASFLEALGDARILGHHADPPRPWSPRIVPSVGTA